jgi:hypothetical protein
MAFRAQDRESIGILNRDLKEAHDECARLTTKAHNYELAKGEAFHQRDLAANDANRWEIELNDERANHVVTANALRDVRAELGKASTRAYVGDQLAQRESELSKLQAQFDALTKLGETVGTVNPGYWGRLAAKVTIERDNAISQAAVNALDAMRWRALLGSARLRPLGCAGLSTESRTPPGYAHIGFEAWTMHDGDNTKENAVGIEWLTKYVDIAINGIRL